MSFHVGNEGCGVSGGSENVRVGVTRWLKLCSEAYIPKVDFEARRSVKCCHHPRIRGACKVNGK